jgi:hypothetical protein
MQDHMTWPDAVAFAALALAIAAMVWAVAWSRKDP